MKNLVFLGSAFILITLLNSCQKDAAMKPVENNQQEVISSHQLSLADVKSEEGVLIFQDWEHVNRVTDELASIGFNEELAFEKKHNFKSQRIILEEVMYEEERIEEEYVLANAGVYEGLNIPKSQAYQEAFRKGLLTVEADTDEEHIYYLSVLDPTLSRVLNEEGFIMVGTVLWQYTSTQIKECSTCKIQDRANLGNITATNDDETIKTYTLDRNLRLYNNWDKIRILWDAPSSDRRARYSRYGYAMTNDNCESCFMIVKYYLHNEAQRKRWGTWKYRSSYEPRFFWDGTWNGIASAWDASLGTTYQIHIASIPKELGVTNTPMVNRWYQGNNNTEVKLHPHYSGSIPVPTYQDDWVTPFNIPNPIIDGELRDEWNNFIMDLTD